MSFMFSWKKKKTNAVSLNSTHTNTFDESNNSRTFNYYADLFIYEKQENSKATQAQAHFIVNGHLRNYFGEIRIHDISSQHCKNYIREKRQTHKVTDHIKYLRAIIKLSAEMGENPQVLKFKNPDPVSEAGKPYEQSDLVKLMWHSRKNKNLRLQIFCAYTMAFRKSEIVHLKWEFLDLDRGICRLPASFLKTKRTRNREFPLNDTALRILRARRKRAPQGQKHVFPGRDHIGSQVSNDASWKRLKKRSGVNQRFHDLRHHAISTMLAAGNPLPFVCQWCGLSIKVAMDVYTHASVEMGRNAMNLKGRKVVQSGYGILKLIKK